VSDVRRSPLARPLTVVLAAALVAGTLAGCTGGPFSGGCTPAYQPGDASTAVSVNGEVGDTPAVTMPTPLIATEPERTVTVEGEGEPIPAGATVLASYVYYEGASGASVNESSALYSASDRSLAIGEALVCATAGSRLVVTGPAEQLVADYPGETATLVAVIDIVEVFLGKANGVNQLPLDGMPTVVTAVDGTPGLALGYQAEVVEPRTATIKAGSGAVVADDATVVFHARSFTWSSPTSADASVGDIDSWSRGTPYVLAPTIEAMGEEVLVDALVGAKVGSQILVVIPDADGAGGATAYVFDILGVTAGE
jgi:hypothetical protein